MKKIAFVCLMLNLAALGLAEDKASKPSAKVKKRVGEKGLAVLTGATRVEVFRIEPNAKAKTGDKQIAGHRITATGKEKDGKFARRLAGVLLKDKTLFGTQMRCFLPGVAFRLHKGDESVEVLICFACENLSILTRDAKGKVIQRARGAFGPERKPLLDVVKAAFPGDKEIQAIKEKR